MTTATGNIEVDFKGLDDVTPYENAGFVNVGTGTPQILGGKLTHSADGSVRLRWAETFTAAVIKSRVEINFADNLWDTRAGALIVKPDGSGYLARIQGSHIYLFAVDATGSLSQFTNVNGFDFGSGSILELRYTPESGDLVAVIDGVLAVSVNDTQYTTDLSPGVYLAGNTDQTVVGLLSFAGDGLAATTLTLDQTSLNKTATVSGAFRGYVGAPTGPLMLSDGKPEPIEVPLTFSDVVQAADNLWNGYFTGTLPDLPADGTSAPWVADGNVDVTLPDPGV